MELDGSLIAGLLGMLGLAVTGLVAAITLLVRMWGRLGRMEDAMETVGKRLDALHGHAVTIREGQTKHERECAERWGRSDAKFEGFEQRLDLLTDQRWDTLAAAVHAGEPP